MPEVPAARWDVQDRRFRQKSVAVRALAGCATLRPAPAFADGFPAVPGARGAELRVRLLTPAVCGCPSDRMFPSGARLPLYRRNNFQVRPPTADRPAARLRGLRESRLRREIRGRRAQQHPGWGPRRGSLAVRGKRPAAPDCGRFLAADRAAAQDRQDLEALCRARCLPLPGRTIARNRAAQRVPRSPATPNAHAGSGSPRLPVAIWLRRFPRPLAARFRSAPRLSPAGDVR